jgi:ABC-type transport system involved in cytochrome c biogenesis permease subunit
MKKWIPLIVVGIVAAWFISTLKPTPDKTFNFTDFGKLPVLSNGRIQPLDSLARNSLLQIREKQEANLDPWKGVFDKPRIISATEWLATLMMDPATADQWPVVRVDNQELISLLKLPGKDLAQKQDGKHYSWAQIQPALQALDAEATRVGNDRTNASERTAYEKAVLKMHERLWLYVQLKNTVQPQDATDWPQELSEYEKLIPAGVAAVQAERVGQKYDSDVLREFAGFVQQFDAMAKFEPPLVIPPQEAGESHDSWKRTGDVLIDGMRDGAVAPAVHSYAAMGSALKSGNAAEFNRQLADYRSALVPGFSRELRKSRSEFFFNHMQPFYNAMIIYVVAGLLAATFWFTFSHTLRRTAMGLVLLALLIHTTGILFRMGLEGRPPVTNLYSSAIFIGWGACVLGLVLEAFWRNAIGLVVSCIIGFLTLIIAQHLAVTGDTMEMMRAVLDTNFWLATHVVVVTLGYASTFVAGVLAFLYVVLGFFTRVLARHPDKTDIGKALSKMVYGIICFATLFSFVGTVLGGIWADQSWGRFWGWDPKENGALIIVLWNAMVLHLRWGGMVRERGVMNCALFGNIVTSWSWFGVNMLGIGLHSYGFMDAAFYWLLAFVASQLALIGIGCIPQRFWKSFQPPPVPPSTESGGTGSAAPAAA